MQNTFNLSIIFGSAKAVITIVCYSEEGLDVFQIQQVANTHLTQALINKLPPAQIASTIVQGVKAECGCEAVYVPADAAIVVGALRN